MDECLLSLSFDSDFRNVDSARVELQTICGRYFGSEDERASDLVTAANEAMNNAVEHSGASVIRVEVVGCGDALGVFVMTEGPPFDPVTASAGLDEEDMLDREEGGYGLYLIRELVDRVEYEFRDSLNILKIFKKVRG